MNAGEKRRLVAAVRGGLSGFATVPGAPSEDGVRVFALPIMVIGQRYTVVSYISSADVKTLQSVPLPKDAPQLPPGIPCVNPTVNGFTVSSKVAKKK